MHGDPGERATRLRDINERLSRDNGDGIHGKGNPPAIQRNRPRGGAPMRRLSVNSRGIIYQKEVILFL